jgi:succinate-acetate transporter protein
VENWLSESDMITREMAVGNTFGATALSSYGGFWIAYGILLTPHWNITGAGGPYATDATKAIDPKMVDSAIGLFLTGWFIFTTILLLCTLRSTVMFFLLFFTLDLAFLMLACGHYASDNGALDSSKRLTQAGGGFGMIAAFLAWYNAFAGIADSRYVFSRILSLFSFSFLATVVIVACGRRTFFSAGPWLSAGRAECWLHEPSRSMARHIRHPSNRPAFAQYESQKNGLADAIFSPQQQLVLPHPRLPLPVVGEGPGAPSRQVGQPQHGACRLDGITLGFWFCGCLLFETLILDCVVFGCGGFASNAFRRRQAHDDAAQLWMRTWGTGMAGWINASDIPCNLLPTKKEDERAVPDFADR